MSYRSQLAFVLIALFFAGSVLAAPFVDNNATPPSGNTDEPINRGTTTQVKDGTLYTGGFGILSNSLLRLPIAPAVPGNPNVAGQVLTLIDASNGDARWLPSQAGGGYWAASGNNISNTNSANVGVGIATPAQKLDVNGNIWNRGSYFKLGQNAADALHDGGEGTLHINPHGGFQRIVFNSNFPKPMTFRGDATFENNICLGGVCRTTWPSGATGGVTSVTAGTGISAVTSGTNVTVSNTGVTQIGAGPGIGLSASTGNVAITNGGVTNIRGTTGSNGAPTVSVNSSGSVPGTGDVIVSVGSQFPAGTKLIFMSPCPAGWTRDSSQDARFLIVSDSDHAVGTQSWTPRTGSDYSKSSDSEGPWLLNTVVVNSPLPPSASPAHSHPVPSVSINICTKN